jgi:opacity protein-like surface antigen
MKHFFKLVAIAILAMSTAVYADTNSNWVKVGSVYILKGSFQESDDYILVIARRDNAPASSRDVVVMEKSACMLGFGTMAITDLGDKTKFSTAYVKGEQKTSSLVGDVMCAILAQAHSI